MSRDHPDAYAVLAASARGELRVQGSRFLALALPLRSELEARAQRSRLRDQHAEARHLCWALRLGHPHEALLRSSDAGEPAGSAGPPIERAIVASGLSDLHCVVLRWFGGTKLGVGGLIRAYGEAARAALATAVRGERLRLIEASGSFPYELESPLRRLLVRLEGEVLAAEYGEHVIWRLGLPPSAWPEFAAACRDLARGRCLFERLAQKRRDRDRGD